MEDDNSKSLPGQHPAALIRALRTMLRPLIKFLLNRGITYPVFSQWLKSLFIEVAESDFSLPDKPQTDSRINLLTGIHRKDVKRLRNVKVSEEAIPKNVSLGALLVAKWTGMQEYQDHEGRPLPLPRQTAETNQASFDQLVISVNKDIRPRVIIDEWLRLGIVSIDENNLIHLNVEAFVPQKGLDELAYYFGRNLRDHIAASAHNLSESEKRFLERSVYYDKLTSESVAELQVMAEKHGMQALQALNRHALALQEKDTNNKNNGNGSIGTLEKNQRINFGVYFYSAEHDESKKDVDN